MTKIKVGDIVEVKTGKYAGQIGRVDGSFNGYNSVALGDKCPCYADRELKRLCGGKHPPQMETALLKVVIDLRIGWLYNQERDWCGLPVYSKVQLILWDSLRKTDKGYDYAPLLSIIRTAFVDGREYYKIHAWFKDDCEYPTLESAQAAVLKVITQPTTVDMEE